MGGELWFSFSIWLYAGPQNDTFVFAVNYSGVPETCCGFNFICGQICLKGWILDNCKHLLGNQPLLQQERASASRS